MDDFNSSDVEIPEAAPRRFAHNGKRSIDSMLQNATDIRRSTKIAVAQRARNFTAPSTESQYELWTNRFKQFLTDVLKKRFRVLPFYLSLL